MNGADAVSDKPAAAEAAVTESETGDNVDDAQAVKSKRPVKMTYKALVEKLERLQYTRKDK